MKNTPLRLITTRSGWHLEFHSDLGGQALLRCDEGTHDFRRQGPTNRLLEVQFPAELLVEVAARALESAADDLEWLSAGFAGQLRVRAAEIRRTGRLP